MSNYANPDFPMNVLYDEGGSITFEWDENHPVTSVFNTWTENDFMEAILAGCRETLGDEEFDRIRKEHQE
jgi:hypothetical protein